LPSDSSEEDRGGIEEQKNITGEGSQERSQKEGGSDTTVASRKGATRKKLNQTEAGRKGKTQPERKRERGQLMTGQFPLRCKGSLPQWLEFRKGRVCGPGWLKSNGVDERRRGGGTATWAP